MRKLIGWVSVGGFVGAAVGLFWGATTQGTPAPQIDAQQIQTGHFKQQNEKAPDFELKDLNGNLVHLSDFEGKIRIIDFWATWCPPCRAEIPHFNSLQTKYSDDVVILGISLDRQGLSVVKPFADQNAVTYQLLLGNPETARAYGGIESIPTTFVIDQQGRFYNKHVGYRPESVFEKDIEMLLSKLN